LVTIDYSQQQQEGKAVQLDVIGLDLRFGAQGADPRGGGRPSLSKPL
jgi:hypothetical protein